MKILIGFRKFIFALITLFTCVTLLYFKYITGGDFAQVISGLSVAFMGANVGERVLDAISKYLEKGEKE